MFLEGISDFDKFKDKKESAGDNSIAITEIVTNWEKFKDGVEINTVQAIDVLEDVNDDIDCND